MSAGKANWAFFAPSGLARRRGWHLKVPFSARKRWGGKGGERGEIQDIFLHPFDAEGLKALLVGAERVLSHNGLLDFGISEWKETYWEGPGDARLQPLCPFGPYRLGYEERDS